MNERYHRILSIDEMYFQEDSPLLLEKAALLFDRKKQVNIFQGRFINMWNKSIFAVYINIGCFDVFGKKLGDVQGSYLDMDISQNVSFGDNIPVEIPYLDARKFVFTISKIAFKDGEIKECALQLYNVANAQSISSSCSYEEQYIREINNLNPRVECKNIVVCNKTYWICSCGALNYKSSSRCRVCNLSFQKQLEVSDVTYLEEKSKAYKEELQKDEEELQKIKEKRTDSIRKILHDSALGTFVIAVVCLVVILIFYFVLPQIKYIEATKCFESKKYDKAIEEYQDIENYRDSKEKMMESKYVLSKKYIQQKKYNKAKSLLESIQDYKKADQYITYINTINSNIEVFDATETYNSLSKLDIDVSKDYLSNNELMKTYIKKLCGNTFCTLHTDEKYIFNLSEGGIYEKKDYDEYGYWKDCGYGFMHIVNINGRWYEGNETSIGSGKYEKGYREIEIINDSKIKITYLINGESHIYYK